MKLRLEIQNQITILTVTEGMKQDQLPVLRAGLTKLFASGKKAIVLDLSDVDRTLAAQPEMYDAVDQLHGLAYESQARLIVISNNKKVAQAASRADAEKLAQSDNPLQSPLERLQSLEMNLQARIKSLEAKKVESEKKMSALEGTTVELKKLRKENSDLRKKINLLENSLEAYLKERPAEFSAPKTKYDALKRTVIAVLEQEGLMPVK